MSEDIPKFNWLNEDFFRKITTSKFDWNENEFKIESYETSFASSKGDSYLGTVLRSKVIVLDKNGKVHTNYYIIKTSEGVAVGGSSEVADQFQAYPKEMEVYENVLPALEKVWKDVGVDINFGPK